MRRLVTISGCLALVLVLAVIYWRSAEVTMAGSEPSRPRRGIEGTALPAQISTVSLRDLRPARDTATLYLDAAGMLPKSSGKQQTLLNNPGSNPEEAAALEQELAAALALFHEASLKPQCDWGIDLGKGPETTLPHIGSAMSLAKFSAFRAQMRLARGDVAGAQSDLQDILRFSRHLTEPQMIITDLVATSVEATALRAVARSYEFLDPAAAQNLSTALAETTSPRAPLSQVVAADTDQMVAWLRAGVAGHQNTPEEFARWAVGIVSATDGTTTSIGSARVEAGGGSTLLARLNLGTPAQFIAAINRLQSDAGEMASTLELPREDFTKAVEAANTAPPATGETVLSRMILPSLLGTRDTRDKQIAEQAMVNAALAYRAGGPSSLEAIPDPFGDGAPFEVVIPQDGVGFELRSKLQRNSKPVSLSFGVTPPPSPAPPVKK